jgi:branched-chain amino acid transport system ATP-binding protein
VSATSAILLVDRVTKVFGGITAVDDVTFDIDQGEIVGLIGPNGSGKSTIINLISGLHQPSRGKIYFQGRPISGQAANKVARAGIARTFQLLRLFQGLTAFENVLTATHLAGSHGILGAIAGSAITRHEEQALRRRAMDALAFVGLAARAAVPARQLAAGEGRLLELARAIAAGSQLVLLDEPAAGLNTAETAVLEERLRTLQAEGRTLLLVDHHMRLVMSLATRVVVLDEGKVLTEGLPSEVQRDQRVVKAYLGSGALRRQVARHG